MKYEIIINAKKLYLGIEILRMFFAFIILFFHCRNRKIYSPSFMTYLIEVVDVGIALFFIISFYFSYSSFTSKKINKIKERFKRLIIPYAIWPIIIYLQRASFKIINIKKKLKFLIYQILIGNGIYCIFWFNFNLIFVLLFFTIIIFITRKYMTFLILFGLIIFLISSSNAYLQFWNRFKFDVKFSVGKIDNTYKLGLIGFFISSKKIIENKINKKFIIIFIFILVLILINKINIIKLFPKYFFSILLIFIFTSIPIEKLEIRTYTFIKQISSYTGGIYYIHPYINSLLKNYVESKSIPRNIFMSVMHYFLCYSICFIGNKLFKKNCLKYLFN